MNNFHVIVVCMLVRINYPKLICISCVVQSSSGAHTIGQSLVSSRLISIASGIIESSIILVYNSNHLLRICMYVCTSVVNYVTSDKRY